MLFGEDPRHGHDILLAERASTLRPTPAKSRSPAAATECDDSGAVATALREAEEETGLDPSGVVPLAVLPELYLPPSGFAVTPVAGALGPPEPRTRRRSRRDGDGRPRADPDLTDPANRLRVRHPSSG